jgi:hypothetical protein
MRDIDASLTWEIENKNIFSGDETGADKIEGYKAIIRNDNSKVLSVMKKSYSPMTNAEFIEIAEKLKEISGFELSGYNEFKDGKKVLGFLKNTKGDISIGGHKMEDYMLIGNSFDGSSSFFIGTTTKLIRCQNQFSLIHEMNRIRHTKHFKSKLDELYAYLQTFFFEREKMLEDFNTMREIKISEEIKEKMIKFVLGVDETSGKKISAHKETQITLVRESMFTEIADLGENMWGAFNGITKYTTHELEASNPTFGNVFGQPADINKKAFDYAMSLV